MKTINRIRSTVLFAIGVFSLFSCKEDNITSDAFGNFDVDETIVSAEVAGRLETFVISEGQLLNANEMVGTIDSTNLILEKEAIQATKKSINAKLIAINAEIKVFEVQLSVMEKEYSRVVKLIAADAATEKQKDDIEGSIEIIKSKVVAAKSQKPAVFAQVAVINANVAKIDNQLSKYIIINPIEGRVLTKLAEPFELVGPGKPLYKVANTDKIYLKAYVTGAQVAVLKMGQKVTVIVDGSSGDLKQLEGVINWISDEAEFTPKLIQTREERVSLVYAIKIGFENDGTIKIGMPGEVIF